MHFPLKEPVLIFGFAVLIFLLFPILMRKLRVPAIIGPIIAGIIIGPNGLEILERDSTIQLLGTVGLLFIMFIAGLELDLDGFKKYRNRSILFGMLSFLIPLVLGVLIGLWLHLSMLSAILFGSIFSTHTLLGYPSISRLGVAKNQAVTTAVGGTLLTDSLALLFLAVITGASEGHLTVGFFVYLIIATALFAVVVLFLTPYLTKWFFKRSNNEGTTEFNFVLAILFVAGAISLFVGLEPIIGAFLAGLALNRYIYDHGPLMNRIRFTANALFIPFFLLSVGMLMDLSVLISSPKALLTIALITIVAIGSKLVASWVTSKVYGYSKNERNVIFGLSTTHAAATLAITLVGYEFGLFDQQIINAVIVVILVTCILGPYLCEKYGRKLAVAQDKTVLDDTLPERILIAITSSNTMESLLDLGIVLKKAKKTEEPIYPLTVVQKDLKQADNEVAQAERMLGHALTYTSGADVPVRLLTRVDHNIGWGIERAATEERITTIIVGWDGSGKGDQKVFGRVIDNLLEHTYQRSLIANINQPLNTVERVILLLPNNIVYKPGFEDSLSIIKDIASQLNATIKGLVIRDNVERYKKVSEQVQPNVEAEFESVDGWNAIYSNQLNNVKSTDLVILLSARKGTVAWHPKLETSPKKLSSMNLENFIVFYPTEMKETDIRGSRGTEVPKELLFRSDYED
ncbi:cation:proton antiporter (plasmid) [Priestia megaterium]|uniref:cation:proton antiporter n=6 Tax=Priestia megaterium TaxID=1404 RepID=UPI000BF25282|nr:cation:proton antiporter [Priestia megaterium]MBM6602108.1 cation:proton antiporter [Priestia megaterium]MBV6738498.1 cation:proton antiporter [Priestia megaterium]MDH3178122.1 cation:proton antiporter [Priestia megaterium]PFI60985.1 cation/H(+) antiporter [Priestia megaterium]PFP09346.1 cation/H(+) antiporter [Priestia megaterium]